MPGISTPSQAPGSGGGGGSSTITSLLGITSSGQKNMAGSLSVAIASDQSTLNVSLTNALKEITGSASSLNADIVPSTDVTAYRSGSLQLTGTWNGAVSIQGSNDNSNFNTVVMESADNGNLPVPVADTTGNNGIYKFPVQFRYLRIRATSYSSGTISGVLELYPESQDLWPTSSFGSDSNFLRGFPVAAANYIAQPGSNGFDMQREVVTGTDSTGLGITAAGILAQFDDVSPSTVTENQFANVRMTASRDLHVSPKPDTLGGWSFNYQSALSSTKAQIKGSAGNFGGYINLYNPNTAVTFIQVFNKASASVTVGTTAPDFVITLPGLATASGTGTDRNLEITCGLAMSTGITIAATTTATNSTAPANAVTATFLFL